MKQWRVYIIRCKGGAFYTGVTTNLDRRLEAHNRGKASKYTRSRLPVTLLAASEWMTKSDALKLESRVKKARRDEKVALLIPKL